MVLLAGAVHTIVTALQLQEQRQAPATGTQRTVQKEEKRDRSTGLHALVSGWHRTSLLKAAGTGALSLFLHRRVREQHGHAGQHLPVMLSGHHTKAPHVRHAEIFEKLCVRTLCGTQETLTDFRSTRELWQPELQRI